MKIIFGSIVADGRGKIAGHVYSKNRAGAYTRTKVTPVNLSSPDQVNVRARFAAAAQAWRGLAESDRLAWNAAVNDYKRTDIFGSVKVPSGFSLYVRLNAQLAAIGVAALTNPPLPTNVSVFATLTGFTADSDANITGTVTPATIPASESVIVRATAPVSAGKAFVKSEFRQIGVLTSLTLGAVDISTMYAAKFGGSAAVGSKIFVEFIHVNETTGQTSQAQQIQMVVEAA